MGDPSLPPHEGDPNESDRPTKPNLHQEELIQTIEGPVLVDAGAGTGKTFTIARRYLHILEARELDPRDVLLITFTRNAAEEMRERILHLGDLAPAKLHDAPISTFHALAKRLLEQDGFQAPTHLGLDEPLAPVFDIVQDPVREAELFADFLRSFREDHPEHADLLAILHDPSDLVDLIRQLASKGIFPTPEGWYRDGEAMLTGDREAFLETARATNARRGNKQSRARERFYGSAKRKLFCPPTLDRDDLVGKKEIHPDVLEDAFDEDRKALVGFLHDLYLGYLAYALARNYLNQPFVLGLAFVLLVEDHELRDRLQYDFVMIDEFQDTSEIQLQLALLFCAAPNLCCVGDWKQSIYSFQYASVENILAFDERVQRYADRLNEDTGRVPPADALTPAHRIPLAVNYRSTQPILDVAKEALVTPATQEEALDEAAIREEIIELESTARLSTSRIEALEADDEIDAVLAKLAAIVGDEATYPLVDEARTTDETLQTRGPTFGDIAVLTRTRAFALELQDRARELGLPIAFEGGVEVYGTDAGKLLLAWLRILEDPRSRRGWAVVLEAAGYTLDEASHHLDRGELPDEMLEFRRRLTQLGSMGAKARAVFERYGLSGGFTEALVAAVQRAWETTRKTPEELVRYLEDSFKAGTTEQVDDHPGGDVVTLQTIHAAKGLEYPIVVLADLNQGRFPSSGGGFPSQVRYQHPIGIRASKVYADPDDAPPYVYDRWQHAILRSCLTGTDHDEERRLFYVAMSRAQQHLILTAQADRPSRFLEEIPIDAETVEATPGAIEASSSAEGPAPVHVETPAESVPQGLPIGELLPEPDIQATGGRGKRFGQRLHGFAARYALGEAVDAEDEDQATAAGFADELAGPGARLDAEVGCALPLDVDGQRYVLEGKIDLLAVDPSAGRVDVVDWKTTPSGEGLNAYRRQVALYAAIVAQAHPDKTIRGWVVYTEDDRREAVDPLPAAEIEALVRDRQAGDL